MIFKALLDLFLDTQAKIIFLYSWIYRRCLGRIFTSRCLLLLLLLVVPGQTLISSRFPRIVLSPVMVVHLSLRHVLHIRHTWRLTALSVLRLRSLLSCIRGLLMWFGAPVRCPHRRMLLRWLWLRSEHCGRLIEELCQTLHQVSI